LASLADTPLSITPSYQVFQSAIVIFITGFHQFSTGYAYATPFRLNFSLAGHWLRHFQVAAVIEPLAFMPIIAFSLATLLPPPPPLFAALFRFSLSLRVSFLRLLLLQPPTAKRRRAQPPISRAAAAGASDFSWRSIDTPSSFSDIFAGFVCRALACRSLLACRQLPCRHVFTLAAAATPAATRLCV